VNNSLEEFNRKLKRILPGIKVLGSYKNYNTKILVYGMLSYGCYISQNEKTWKITSHTFEQAPEDKY
jgi:hypothetical protein